MNNLESSENKSEFQQIIEKLEKIETAINRISGQKESQIKEKLLDNSDMCLLLGVTKRTIQRYRQKGVVPYYMMHGKSYYKASEVQECLKRIMKGKK